MRYKGNAEANSCGGNPTVCVVVALGEGMTQRLAIRAQLGVGLHQLRARPDDLGVFNTRLQPLHAVVAPLPSQSPVPHLGNGLERNESRAAGDERLVSSRQGGAGYQLGGEDAGVDHTRPAVGGRDAHPSTAARKARPARAE